MVGFSMISLKNIITSVILGLSFTTSAFAGSEDWDGQYIFQTNQGKSYMITHSPTRVQFMFFNIGECLSLSKGSSLNGMIIPTDVKLCRMDNVETFTNEVQKLGNITSKKITLGPTYTN